CPFRLDGRSLRNLYVHLTAPDINVVDIDLCFCPTSDNSSVSRIELRTMPGTLNRAPNQRAIGQGPTFMSAGVAEGKQSLRASANHDSLVADDRQQHLSIP